MSALRFFYRVTLQKWWSFDDVIPAPKKPQSSRRAPCPLEIKLNGVQVEQAEALK